MIDARLGPSEVDVDSSDLSAETQARIRAFEAAVLAGEPELESGDEDGAAA